MLTYGQHMRRNRLMQGLNITELAEKADVARATLSRYENDKAEPRLMPLIALASALEMGLDEYLGLQIKNNY